MPHKQWDQLIPECPTDWALIPCDGLKRPVDPATGQLMERWEQQDGLDVEGLLELNGYVKSVGLLLGPASSGVLAVDFDGPEAIAKFKEIFGRSPNRSAQHRGRHQRQAITRPAAVSS